MTQGRHWQRRPCSPPPYIEPKANAYRTKGLLFGLSRSGKLLLQVIGMTVWSIGALYYSDVATVFLRGLLAIVFRLVTIQTCLRLPQNFSQRIRAGRAACMRECHHCPEDHRPLCSAVCHPAPGYGWRVRCPAQGWEGVGGIRARLGRAHSPLICSVVLKWRQTAGAGSLRGHDVLLAPDLQKQTSSGRTARGLGGGGSVENAFAFPILVGTGST